MTNNQVPSGLNVAPAYSLLTHDPGGRQPKGRRAITHRAGHGDARFNKSTAAGQLGLTRAQRYAKVRRYRLE